MNLAGALAQSSNTRVLIIDADLHRPAVAEYLGLSDRRAPALAEAILHEEYGLAQTVRRLESLNVSVLLAGNGHLGPYELLASPASRSCCGMPAPSTTTCIIDTPPVVPLADCRLLGRLVDGFIVVVAANRTPRKLVAEALNLLDPAKVIGVVFNGDDRPLARALRLLRLLATLEQSHLVVAAGAQQDLVCLSACAKAPFREGRASCPQETQALRVRLARAAALLAVFSVVLISSRQAVAQFGSLVVTMTSPASGSTVSGTITASASVSVIGALTVAGVQFQLDGANLGAEDTTAPYSIAWNTKTASNGSHSLRAVARDSFGVRWTSEPVTVTVFNDTTPPIVSVTTPAPGRPRRHVAGRAPTPRTSRRRGRAVQARRRRPRHGGHNGAVFRLLEHDARQQRVAYPDGGRARRRWQPDDLRDRDRHRRQRSPNSDDHDARCRDVGVGAAVTVTAAAADNMGVAGVRFLVDGVQVGVEDTVAPYSISWDTTTVTDGSYTLTAIARDAAGNTTTAAGVTVTVSQVASDGDAYRGDGPVNRLHPGHAGPGQPSDWWHGSRSRGWTLGTASFNRSAGARATFSFSGTSVRWIGFRAPWAGIARVFVDGTFVTELDLYQETEQAQATVFTATNLAAGTHTLAVESTGRKHVSAVDYAVVVDAFDVSPASPPPPTGTRFEETAATTSFTAGWTPGDTTNAWSGATAAVSVTPGARAVFTFAGTSVRWVGLSGPQTGIARIFLDGAFQGQIDTYAPTEIQAVLFTVTGLAGSPSPLEVEVTGLKNAAATNSVIVVDAFDTRPRFEETDPSITYSGAWTGQDTIRAYSSTSLQNGGGTAARSATAGARAEFAFTGTSVSWIGLRGPWLGIADVFVDGGFAARVDLYAATEAVQATVFSASGLPAGTHTLRIDVTGERNPAANSAFVDGRCLRRPVAGDRAHRHARAGGRSLDQLQRHRRLAAGRHDPLVEWGERAMVDDGRHASHVHVHRDVGPLDR